MNLWSASCPVLSLPAAAMYAGCRKDTASLGDKELQQVLKKGKYKERGWEVRADKDAGTASMAKTFELCDFDEGRAFVVHAWNVWGGNRPDKDPPLCLVFSAVVLRGHQACG